MTEPYVYTFVDRHDEIYGATRRAVHPAREDTPTPSVETPSASVEPAVPAPPECEEPPLGGAGSGRESWAVYAGCLGLTVTDTMTRDDIVMLTRQHTGG